MHLDSFEILEQSVAGLPVTWAFGIPTFNPLGAVGFESSLFHFGEHHVVAFSIPFNVALRTASRRPLPNNHNQGSWFMWTFNTRPGMLGCAFDTASWGNTNRERTGRGRSWTCWTCGGWSGCGGGGGT